MIKLFLVFLRVGLFSFGGGNAAMPYIKFETVDKNKWISEEDFFELVAISNSLPGPNVIQVCTYIAYKAAKMKGLILAAIAIMGPNAILFTIAVTIFRPYIDIETMDKIATGSMWFVLALLLNLCFKLVKKSWLSKGNKIVLVFLFSMSVIMMILNIITPIIIIASLLVIYTYSVMFDKTKAELPIDNEVPTEGGTV